VAPEGAIDPTRLPRCQETEPSKLDVLVRAVKDAQSVLAPHIEPSTPPDPGITIDHLLGILDHEDVVRAVQALELNPAREAA
jgi:hypothetical protein